MTSVRMGRLLVTGSRGFVGRHVSEACAPGGALEGWVPVDPPEGWDIRDEQAVNAFLGTAQPDAVLHLAAQSFVPRSFEAPRETFDINLMGTLNLLRGLSAQGFKGRLIFVSSGDIYGRVPEDELPVDERRLPEPRSPYAVSKVAAEQLCLQWHRTEGIDVTIARPFNHIGPGQSRKFVLPALAKQIAAIETGSQEPVIEAGDIDTTRDFTDVRDVVRAYAALLARGVPGKTYCVGSGVERRVRDLLDMMCAMARVNPAISQDASKIRPAEQRRMVADASLLRTDTDWAPVITIETTLKDILNDARNHS